MSGVIVAEEDEDVWVVLGVAAEPLVAESRVVVVADDEPKVVMVRLPKGKRKTVDGSVGDEGSEVDKSEVEVVEERIIVATSISRKLKGMVVVDGAPVGPSGMGMSGRGSAHARERLFWWWWWWVGEHQQK